MNKISYQYFVLVVLALLVWISPCLSQNLVPNPSFEEYTQCPDWISQIEYAPPWTTANQGTPDYNHVCAPWIIGVPENQQGYQWPQDGDAYTGIYAKAGLLDEGREYIIAPLDTTLTAGAAYYVSFYVSPAEDLCLTIPMGALFTVDTPVYNAWYVLDDYVPQIETYCGFLGGYTDWIEISGCFIAEGGERYITIGNFRVNDESPVDQFCPPDLEASYYYVDAVTVEERPLSFEEVTLDPVTACGLYLFDPGEAQSYLWEDGTTCSIRYVTESGTYSVTTTNDCSFTTVEIAITIIPDPPPVILPEDDTLCIGETIVISLDPEAGDYLWQDGSTASDYVISTQGLYSVTLTDACDVTTDDIQVTYIDVPAAFSLGSDTLICNGDEITFAFDPSLGYFTWQDHSTHSSTYSITEAGMYSLTISNDCGYTHADVFVGTIYPPDFTIGSDDTILCVGDNIGIELDPNLGTFEWHDGSTLNSYSVTMDEVVSVTVTNSCFSASDTLLVTSVGPPFFSLGPDLTVCQSELPIIVDLSGIAFAEEFQWNDGSTNGSDTINAAGTYSVTISNGCFWEADEVQITVANDDPVITLPDDQFLCIGQQYVLDASGFIGTYQWQDMSTADTFLVTQAGTYALTVTNICGSGTDTVIINYIPELAPPNLGPDFSLCPGLSGVLYANSDGVSYQWSEGAAGTISTADSIVITSPGIYSLQISDECTSATDTIVITSNANPPDVELPDVVDLCQDDSVVIEAGITGVDYLWQDSSVASQFIATMPGVYTLQVSNACGTDIDSVVINDAGAEPLVMLGEDISLCPGDVVEIIPVSMDVDTWLWNDSSTSSTFHVQSSGTIIVQASNQCGQMSDTLVVTELPDVPPLDLGDDIALCPGESETLSIDVQDVEILWSDKSTGSDFEISTGGLVFATISNACGSSSDTVSVELLPDIPDLDLGADQSLCSGETITIDPGIPDVEYLWQDGSNEATYETSIPGTIILTISNACGTSTDTVVIIEDTNGPQVDLGPDILACEGDTVILDAGISGVDYLWQDGSAGSMFNVQSSGTFILHVSNQCGMDSDTILVDIHGTVPNPSLGADTTLCEGEVLTLISDADAETSIKWHDGSMASSFLVSEEGFYSLTETNHCGSASDTIVVAFVSAPAAFDLGEDVVLCPGDSIILIAPATTDLITWQDGSHGVSFIADQEKVYSLQISNDCGVSSDEVVVSFDQDMPVVDLEPSLSICPDQSVTLDVTQSFEATYLWSTGSTLPSIVITQPDVYAVTISTDCYAETDDILIETDGDCGHEIFIPNVFSPNGDNVNDEWIVHITTPNVILVKCSVFDRWGDLVFLTADSPIVWDGIFNGKKVSPDVYVYLVKLTDSIGETKILSGDLTLIR